MKALGWGVLVAVILAGCSSEKERADWDNSGGVLYPIAKIGDLFSTLGDGIHTLGTPGTWNTRPDRTYVQELPDEQLAQLNASAVRVDPSEGASEGLGAGALIFSEPWRTGLLTVERIAQARFDWYISPQVPDVGISQPNGVILVNPVIMARYQVPTQYFWLLHEASHHLLGHATYAGAYQYYTQPWLNPQREMDADANAARLMLSAGFTRDQVMYAALEMSYNNPGDASHPPGAIRYENIRRVVAGQIPPPNPRAEPGAPGTPPNNAGGGAPNPVPAQPVLNSRLKPPTIDLTKSDRSKGSKSSAMQTRKQLPKFEGKGTKGSLVRISIYHVSPTGQDSVAAEASAVIDSKGKYTLALEPDDLKDGRAAFDAGDYRIEIVMVTYSGQRSPAATSFLKVRR